MHFRYLSDSGYLMICWNLCWIWNNFQSNFNSNKWRKIQNKIFLIWRIHLLKKEYQIFCLPMFIDFFDQTIFSLTIFPFQFETEQKMQNVLGSISLMELVYTWRLLEYHFASNFECNIRGENILFHSDVIIIYLYWWINKIKYFVHI